MSSISNTALVELEQSLGRQLDSLAIFNLPLETALIYLLRIFEDRSRLPMIAAISRGKSASDGIETAHSLAREAMGALSILLPLLYRKNRRLKKMDPSAYKDKNYNHAGSAIEFANIYSDLKDAIRLAQIKTYFLMKGKDGHYFVPQKESIDYDARAQLINIRSFSSDLQRNDIYLPQSSLIDLFRPYLTRGASSLITRKKNGAFIFNIPTTINNELQLMFESVLRSKWTLDDEIQIGVYQVGDAKKLWVSLAKICAFHESITTFSGLPGIGMEYLPAVVEKKDIVELLSRDTGIQTKKVSEFISDITFNQAIETNEIMFQPLVPASNSDILFFSPHMILFSNPERNLMKLWARRYPGPYGAKIAKKGKDEERSLKDEFEKINQNFIAVCSKKLTYQGRVLTDIDIALYDKVGREALFIQMKWCMQPDSTIEVRDVDSKLNDGMEQLRKISGYLHTQLDAYENIFGKGTQRPKKVFMCVVSTSSTGSFWVKTDYVVFNKDIVLNIISRKKFSSIAEIYKALNTAHSFISHVDYNHVFRTLSFNKNCYFLPATRILENRNLPQKIYDWFSYFLFRLLLRDHYLTWPKIKNPSIFMKD